jgi:hypothetical protein
MVLAGAAVWCEMLMVTPISYRNLATAPAEVTPQDYPIAEHECAHLSEWHEQHKDLSLWTSAPPSYAWARSSGSLRLPNLLRFDPRYCMQLLRRSCIHARRRRATMRPPRRSPAIHLFRIRRTGRPCFPKVRKGQPWYYFPNTGRRVSAGHHDQTSVESRIKDSNILLARGNCRS